MSDKTRAAAGEGRERSPLDFEQLGDLMKSYESAEADRKALVGLPVIARLDGRAFHTFTRGMERPFDPNMARAMLAAAEALVEDLHPAVAHTQSDEITVAWVRAVPFDGRFQKIASVGASICTAAFNDFWQGRRQFASFDGRAWQVPSREAVLDCLAWREADAVKNSVSMACRAYYSHKEMNRQGRADQMDMLHAKGVNWNDYPAHFKRGVYLQRRTIERALTEGERARIPEAHRPPPEAKFMRSRVEVLDLPPIRKVENALDLLLPGIAPAPSSPSPAPQTLGPASEPKD